MQRKGFVDSTASQDSKGTIEAMPDLGFSMKPAGVGWDAPISERLADNLDELRAAFDLCSDFSIREFHVPSLNRNAAVAFMDGLVKHESIMDNVLKPLMVYANDYSITDLTQVKARILLSSDTKIIENGADALSSILRGDALLMIDGMPGAATISVRGWERRSISEPQTETVVFGPREGFTETLRTNTALLRRRIATNDLRMEMMTIGTRTHTSVCVTYLKGIAEPEIVQEVKRRLSTVDVDMIEGSGSLMEYIESEPASVFETVAYTEKPDVVCAKLLEGRVGILVDGSPFCLTVPMLFVECFQSAEDYSIRPFYATFLRLLRLAAFVISLVLPAVYVALASYHQELIPNALLFTMAASSEGLPFPAIVETALMLVVFEILKEAGIRLPKPVGQAISIVGALVMGQAAIQAGIVGAPVVIIVALTGVASFAVPTLSNSVSLLRWLLLLLAAMFGGYGVTLGILAVMTHLASLKSFGVLYLNPLAPMRLQDLKDTLIRAPLWSMKNRPVSLHPQDTQRQKAGKPAFERGNR
ncbi:spore germination protein [Clostridia bacterium]|nr:spore germination protein [Clostridia bacterium]